MKGVARVVKKWILTWMLEVHASVLAIAIPGFFGSLASGAGRALRPVYSYFVEVAEKPRPIFLTEHLVDYGCKKL